MIGPLVISPVPSIHFRKAREEKQGTSTLIKKVQTEGDLIVFSII